MKTLTAILTALVLALGLGVYALATTPQSTSVAVVVPPATATPAMPTTPAMSPPTVINVPLVTLASERVQVSTVSAPVPVEAPVEAYEPHYSYTPYVPVAQPVTYPVAGPGYECTEDMACWNCATMGNKICGQTEAVILFTVYAQSTVDYTPTELVTAFHETYLGLYPLYADGSSYGATLYQVETVGITSEVNPAYEYLFLAQGNPLVQ